MKTLAKHVGFETQLKKNKKSEKQGNKKMENYLQLQSHPKDKGHHRYIGSDQKQTHDQMQCPAKMTKDHIYHAR